MRIRKSELENILDEVEGFLSASLDFVDDPDYIEGLLDKIRAIRDKIE